MTHEKAYHTYTQEYQAVIEDLKKARRVNPQRWVFPLERGLIAYDLARLGSGATALGGIVLGVKLGENAVEKGLYAALGVAAATLIYRVVKRHTDGLLEEGKQELANTRGSSLEAKL